MALMIWGETRAVWAAPIPARETADVLPPGAFEVGVLNPLRVGLPHVELETHPLVALLAPQLDAKVPLVRALSPGGVRVTGILGLGVPTPAWRHDKPFGLSGDLVPSCKVAARNGSLDTWCEAPGTILAAKVGASFSKGLAMRDGQEKGVLTLSADVSKGFVLSGEAAAPLDAWAPVSVAMAPYLGAWRAQLQWRYDHAVSDGLRLRGEVGAYWIGRPTGEPLSRLLMSAYAGVDVRTSEHTRLTVGTMVWNADKHHRVVQTGPDGFAEVRYVRSYEVWPTVDFVWRY